MVKSSGDKKYRITLSKSDIKRSLTEKFKFFTRSMVKLGLDAFEKNYRILIVLSGGDSIRQGLCTAYILYHYFDKLSKNISKPKILHMFRREFEDETIKAIIVKRLIQKRLKNAQITIDLFKRSERYMGRTIQALIMDLTHGIKPNDIGRLIGIVEGGGIVILLTPSIDEWPFSRNLFSETLTTPKYSKPRNVFVRWFISTLYSSEGVFIYDLGRDETLIFSTPRVEKIYRKDVKIPEERIFPVELYKLALTEDQVRVIKAIESMIPKPRKRKMIVVTADRGRGKSGAIGIALPGLIKELLKVKNRVRVGVTALSPANIESLMNLARKALDELNLKYRVIERSERIIELRGVDFSIEYWEPIVIPRLDLDVVVVDEAAGLPVNMLLKIWRNFNRIIMATTIHGYEGAGRGFSLRFLKRVKSDPDTELIQIEMEEPIRYSPNDPVEKWVFKALLLDAEPEPLTEEDYDLIKKREFTYLKLDAEDLFREENIMKLKSVFGIYVEAHYRNEPDDLAMIADAPHHRIRALALANGKIVASAQLAEEGDLPEEIIREILERGSVHGNIIPDRILKYYRDSDFARKTGYRIVRIAVHPEAQGLGIGSYFLERICEEAREQGFHWVGSGFGASEELLRFWIKNGFLPIHISPSRNPVSGEYSVLVLKSIDRELDTALRDYRRRFRERFVETLYDVYRDIETDIALLLIRPVDCENLEREETSSLILDHVDRARIELYLKRYMTYEVVGDLMVKIVKAYWKNPCPISRLEKEYERLIIAKVLQGRSWDSVASELNIRKSYATELMRKIIGRIYKLVLQSSVA
ncbi:MAG: GNAT family N-acetyltransferase [Sulfolobales archaeon]